MSEPMRQESPLVERIPPTQSLASVADAGVVLRELPRFGCVNLRGDVDDEMFVDAVADAAGCRPPREPNTVVTSDRADAIWLGPDEWYLRTAPGQAGELVDRLEHALADRDTAINDLSSGLATFALEGANARDVLEKGCTLDLHPRVFAEGQCAQTLLAKAAVVLLPTARGFEIIVRRSFADYLFVWLTDAADEFTLTITDSS